MTIDVPHHFPSFLWDLWSGKPSGTSPGASTTLHVYDAYNNELTSAPQKQPGSRRVFLDIFRDRDDAYAELFEQAITAEDKFTKMEENVKRIIHTLNKDIYASPGSKAIPINRSDLWTLTKYFSFLRFRNSIEYSEIVNGLAKHSSERVRRSSMDITSTRPEIYNVVHNYVDLATQRVVLLAFIKFFECTLAEGAATSFKEKNGNKLVESITKHCWGFAREADVCVGVIEDDCEFVLTDRCFGVLDEAYGASVQETNPECLDAFFPIHPRMALYMIGGGSDLIAESPLSRRTTTLIQVGVESSVDVSLRNAMILSSVPRSYQSHISTPSDLPLPFVDASNHQPLLYFSCLSSMARSISSYDEYRGRWMQDRFFDYSRLKQRCRNSYLQESVTKMLVVKGDVSVFDLTEEVEYTSKDAVACGSFSDVWQGKWWDAVERQERIVAIKCLRHVLVQAAKEKFIKRLHAEIVTWNSLSHRNVAPLFGLIQTSSSIGMVSPWCINGTVVAYLKTNSEADRLRLITQVAAGIDYLHTVNPPVIHGDLKGGNILIDIHCQAIITDFGLSKVMEDLSSTVPEIAPTSLFAGSMRWMAPELVLALIEDDGRPPSVTKYSDVYAFASVCIEIITGLLPYPLRRNDASVVLDITRGVPPTRGVTLDGACLGFVHDKSESAFWELLGKCWHEMPPLRPTMGEVWRFLVRQERYSAMLIS